MKYQVFLNETELTVHPARTSAIPFNRVWPGKQRAVEQTEISYFVSFDMSAPVTLRVEVLDADVRTLSLRPIEFGIPFELSGNTVLIHLDRPQKFSFEVNGYAEALHIFANEPDCFTPDENTIYFGPGEHDAGMIIPESGQTVYLAEGAVVYGAIYAINADNVTVCGRGILDSSRMLRGVELRDLPDDPTVKSFRSLNLPEEDLSLYSAFNAHHCKNLKLEGIILRDAPFWVVIVRNGCENVLIDNIKIIGQWRYNSDGVDICNSRHVLMRDCFVRAFDDCIVVRAPHLPNETGGCEDNIFEDNVLWCDWGKNLEIWSGRWDSHIRNVRFRNNYLTHVCHRAISIDTWYGAENILVEDVVYEDIHIDTDTDPMYPVYQEGDDMIFAPDVSLPPPEQSVYIDVGKIGRDTGNQQCDSFADTSHYKIAYRDVHFVRVNCNGSRRTPVYINRTHLCELKDVTFTDCTLGDFEIR